MRIHSSSFSYLRCLTVGSDDEDEAGMNGICLALAETEMKRRLADEWMG